MRSFGWIALLVACSSESSVECHFGDDRPVAEAEHAFDRIRMIGDALYWSAPDGLWVREGERTVRLDARCDGGFDVAETEDGRVVACVRRPTHGDPGSLVWLRFEAYALRERVEVARVGRDSRGVAMEQTSEGWRLLWHDGTPGNWQIWSVVLVAGVEPEAMPASSFQIAALSPTTWREDDHVWMAWGESWIDAGFPRGQVMVWSGNGTPRRVMEVNVQDPRPVLIRDERSRVLFFRDFRRPYRRIGLYVVRLDDRFRPMAEPERVGRANADGAIRVLPCAGSLAVMTPRTWDEDLLIAINVLDSDLRKRIAEQQVYEWNAHFSEADVACIDDELRLVVGEQGRGTESAVRAHAITLTCR